MYPVTCTCVSRQDLSLPPSLLPERVDYTPAVNGWTLDSSLTTVCMDIQTTENSKPEHPREFQVRLQFEEPSRLLRLDPATVTVEVLDNDGEWMCHTSLSACQGPVEEKESFLFRLAASSCTNCLCTPSQERASHVSGPLPRSRKHSISQE